MLSLRAIGSSSLGSRWCAEYDADVSPDFPPNGTEMPGGFGYFELMISQFANWRLKVEGLVRKPQSLSLKELKELPARTQVTQHNCDEGWTAIGQWTGVPLAHVLGMAELAPEARYVVFHCLDEMVRGAFYYESIDLFDAFHPQTISLWHERQDLPTPGAVRLQVSAPRRLQAPNSSTASRWSSASTHRPQQRRLENRAGDGGCEHFSRRPRSAAARITC